LGYGGGRWCDEAGLDDGQDALGDGFFGAVDRFDHFAGGRDYFDFVIE